MNEVIWTADAHYQKPTPEPDLEVIFLTRNALARGICPDAKMWNEDFNSCDYSKVRGTGRVGLQVMRINTPGGPVIVVAEVIPEFPAEKAGMKKDDIIVSCNGKGDFKTKLQFIETCKVEEKKPITFEVKRGDKTLKFSPVAGSRSEFFLGKSLELFEEE